MSLGEVFTLLGYAAGAAVFRWAARERGTDTAGFRILAFVGLFAGILGAKVTQLVADGAFGRAALANPALGGRALLGGLIVGWIAVEIAKRKMGIRRSSGDLFALALPAGEAIGRIGCFLNWCCYGTRWSGPLSVFQHEAPRHPVQLYSSLSAILIFGGLLGVKGRLRREGDLFRLYLILFGAARFGLEFLRERETLFYGLSPMQWLCAELVVGTSLWFVWLFWKNHRTEAARA